MTEEPLTLHPWISGQGDIVVLQLTGLLLAFATAACLRQLSSAVLCLELCSGQTRLHLSLVSSGHATGLKAQVERASLSSCYAGPRLLKASSCSLLQRVD